jgi:hypothetical protein
VSECGAIPRRLIDYALWGKDADGKLARQAQALGEALDAFRSSQPDPKYIGSIPALDQQVSEYARRAATTDDWVGRVGEAFKLAGQQEVALSARRGVTYDVLTTRVIAAATTISALALGAEDALRADAATFAANARTDAGRFLTEQRVATDPKLAAEVNAWWHGLDPRTQQQLITFDAPVIGALDGLPATVRDRANRENLGATYVRLTAEKARLEAQVARDARMPQGSSWSQARLGVPPLESIQIGALQQQIDHVDGLLQGIHVVEERIGQPGVYLLGFDANGLGHAIVSFGNPDTARNVVTYVPGFGSRLSGVAHDLNRASALLQQVQSIHSGQRTASIYWLGYDAPQLGLSMLDPAKSVANDALAKQGAPKLDSFAAGLHAAHVPSFAAHTVMLGHSYGSLLVGVAAVRALGRLADDLIFVGSPGVDVNHARDLGVPPSHVWVGKELLDPIAYIGDPNILLPNPFGPDPALPSFGARVLRIQPGSPQFPNLLHAHSQYWDHGSPSLKAMALIVAGMYGRVHTYPMGQW